jgi:Co/Zn/Cd efflux system component
MAPARGGGCRAIAPKPNSIENRSQRQQGEPPTSQKTVKRDGRLLRCVMPIPASDHRLSQIVRLVALLNLSYFGVEFAVALVIGSVSLCADSIDFLEDASIC